MKVFYWVLLNVLRIFIHIIVFVTTPIYTLLYEGKKGKLKDPGNPLLLKPATELASMIRTRKVTSVEVVNSYICQIKAVNGQLNAVVKERYNEAITEAGKVDQVLDSGQVPDEWSVKNAPLLGVPITVKECFALKGMPQTSGLLSRRNCIADEDAVVVARLKKAGAIPLGITNVSELCMWMESTNLVYGRTSNAYHHGRIVGGSSGGEACIISAAGSVIGIGSDIGGSIRMPAYFNGIFGHKPTTGIVANEGQYPIATHKAYTFLSTGPLCRYATDLKPMLHIMAGPDTLRLDLDHKVDVSKLKYYYMEDDGGSYLPIPVNPQIKHKIRKAVAHFQALGASVERVNLKNLAMSFEIWSSEMNCSGNDAFCLLMGDRKKLVSPIVELVRWCLGRPRHTLPAIGLGFGEKLRNPADVDAQLIRWCDELKDDFRELLGSDGVFLYPTHPVPAPYHNQPLLMLFNFAYTGIFNTIGLPVSQVPMGLAKEGIPLGLQVAANFHHDHLSLAVAEELERAFGGWVPPF